MAPQIQRARAALRAIHRMDALMRASHAARNDLEAPESSSAVNDGQEDLTTPLMDRQPTAEEAVAADARAIRPSGMSISP